MQIKVTARQHPAPTGMAVSERREVSTGEDAERKQTLGTIMGTYTGAATVDNSMAVPQKFKIQPPYDPAVLLGDIRLEKTNALRLGSRYAHQPRPLQRHSQQLSHRSSGSACLSVDDQGKKRGGSPHGQRLRLPDPSAGGPGLIPGQGTNKKRFCVPQLRPGTAKEVTRIKNVRGGVIYENYSAIKKE